MEKRRKEEEENVMKEMRREIDREKRCDGREERDDGEWWEEEIG